MKSLDSNNATAPDATLPAMMSIQVRRIRDAVADIRERGRFSQREAPDLLILTRQLLESERAQSEEYPVVKLYCNWCVHSEITKSTLGYEILRDATTALNHDIRNGTVTIANPGSGVSAALAVTTLYEQLLALFSSHDLDAWPFVGANFRIFIGAVLDAIEDAPLSFPQQRKRIAARVYAQIEQAADHDPRGMIVRLTLTKDLKPEQLSFYGVPEGTFIWQADTASGYSLAGVLYGRVP